MRKFLWMVAVGGLVLALAAPVMALDFKFGGEYRMRFTAADNVGGNNGGNPSDMFDHNSPNRNLRSFQLRVRPRFDVSDDNGNVQATLRLEIGDVEFGNGGGAQGVTNGTNAVPSGARVGNGAGGMMGNDGVNVETKWAYLDFAIPNFPLRIRTGLQPWYLPKGIIIDDDTIGIRAYGTYAPITYEFAWYRETCGPLATTSAGSASFPSSSAARANCIGGAAYTNPYPSTAVPNLNGGTTGPGTTFSAPSGVAGLTTNNTFDWYQIKVDAAIAKWLNPGFYAIYGQNKSTSFGNFTPAANWYLGVTATGQVGIVSYDFDFLWGNAEGGPAGTNVGNNGVLASTTGFVKMEGFMFDAGVHVPVGPLTFSVVGSYASGDSRKSGGNSNAMPYISPSWNGAGGIFELIGSGGNFDQLDNNQDYPANLWMIGGAVEYRPVKALWLRLVGGYAGFSHKVGNCALVVLNSAGQNTACFGSGYTQLAAYHDGAGTAQMGTEVSFRADYDLWTGLKIQGAAGVLIPKAGVTATELVMQFLYAF